MRGGGVAAEKAFSGGWTFSPLSNVRYFFKDTTFWKRCQSIIFRKCVKYKRLNTSQWVGRVKGALCGVPKRKGFYLKSRVRYWKGNVVTVTPPPNTLYMLSMTYFFDFQIHESLKTRPYIYGIPHLAIGHAQETCWSTMHVKPFLPLNIFLRLCHKIKMK